MFNGVDVGGPVGNVAADCGMGWTGAGNDAAGTGCNGTAPNGDGWAVVNVSFGMGTILAVVTALFLFLNEKITNFVWVHILDKLACMSKIH